MSPTRPLGPGPRALVALLLAGAAASPGGGAAQTVAPPGLRPGDTISITPSLVYRAGSLRRFMLGDGHRELWATPVPAEVLDMDRFAGGLDAIRRGGGRQTRALRLRGADGIEYNFRSLDKDARQDMDPFLRETLAASVLQDRVSALFPLGALVVDPLLEAAGVLHARPRLVVLPDHARLGEFRGEFAGLVGWLEVRADEGEGELPGFDGATLVVGTPRLLERIEEERGNRVDGAAFLRARLLDLLMGDWDRHPDQWRWAGFPEGDALVFRPVPRDRDWAFAHLDGLTAALTWVPWPHVVGFGHDYPSVFRLTWSARALDRRLLSGLAWAEWEAVLADLQPRLTDAVLTEAVAQLPASHRGAAGDALFEALRHRRDGLPEMARRFYDLLAEWVDVATTDESEVAELAWESPAAVRVTVGVPGAPPTFQRTFHADETREVRLDLRGGDDRARVTGGGESIQLRVIGGGGTDQLEDATSAGRVGLYDDDRDTRFVTGARTRVDGRAWDAPMDLSSSTHQSRARDWGARWIPIPEIGFEPDVGLYLGAGAQYTVYGFRHFPYRSRLEVRAAFGTNTGRPRGSLTWDLPLGRERLRADVGVAYEGAEVPRFHGFGNETSADRPEAFYEAGRASFAATAGVRLLPRRGASIRVGASLLGVRPDHAQPTLIDSVSPYGQADFERVALGGGLTWAAQDDPLRPRWSGRVALSGYLAPAWRDVVEPYGGVAVEASARAAFGGPLRPVVVARAGGERLSGPYPVFDAATLGGRSTLRGYRSRRFAGDASLFAGAEARVFLHEFAFLLPGDFGLLALADAGRVFRAGESSHVWHSSWGVGAWASFFDAFAVSVSRVQGSEGPMLYLGAGVPF